MEIIHDHFGRCLADKCVWKDRILHVSQVALNVGYEKYLSIKELRKYADIDPKSGLGTRISRALKDAMDSYIIKRIYGISHAEAFSVITDSLPPALSPAVGYIEKVAKMLIEKPEPIIKENQEKLPETGWKYFEESEMLMTSPTYAFEFFNIIKRSLNGFVGIAFCNENECYPVPMGLYPSKYWEYVAFSNKRQDLIFKIQNKHGVTTYIDYLSIKAQADEYAFNVILGKKARIYIFVKVSDPLLHATQLYNLQQDVNNAMLELDASKGGYGVGLNMLGLTAEDFKNVFNNL